MAKPTLDEIWSKTIGQAPGMPPVMIDPQVGSGSFDLNGTSGMIEQPQFGGQIPQIGMNPQEPKKSFGKKAIDFLGQATGISGIKHALTSPGRATTEQNAVSGVTEEANRLINEASKYKKGDPKRLELLRKAKALNDLNSGIAEKSLAGVPTDRQGLSSVAKLGMTALTLGAGTPATLGGRLAYSAATGGGFMGLDSAERGDDWGEIAKNVGKGAVIGLAAGGLFEGVRWAAQNLPKRLFAGVSGFTNTEMRDPKTQKALQYALDNKRMGTASHLMEVSQREIEKIGGQIDDVLASAGRKSAGTIDDVVESIIAKHPNAGFDAIKLRQFLANAVPDERVVIETSKKLTAPQMNALRKAVGSQLGDTGFRNSANKLTKDVIKDFYFGLSDKVESLVPGTQKLLSQQSAEITLLDGLEAAAQKSGNNKILSLGDLVLGGGGFAGAGPLGAIGAVALNKTLHSTLVNTVAANLVQPISNILIKLAPAEQQLIIQAIANAK